MGLRQEIVDLLEQATRGNPLTQEFEAMGEIVFPADASLEDKARFTATHLDAISRLTLAQSKALVWIAEAVEVLQDSR